MGEVILFTSGKGGVGKTTIVANIGAGLALKEKKTVIVDMNQGLRGMDIVLGLGNHIVYNIFDVLNKRSRLSQVLIKDPKREGLSLLPSSQVRKQEEVDPDKLKEIIETLRSHFDYILIDGCSGLDMGFYHSALDYDRAIIVCTPDVMSVRAADKVKEELRRMGCFSQSILINRIKTELLETHDMMSREEIEDMMGLDVVGMLTEENDLYISSNNGETIVAKESISGQSFRRITDRLLGKEISLPEFTSKGIKKTGFWSFLTKG